MYRGWNPWRVLRAREDVILAYKQHHPSTGRGSVVDRGDGVLRVYLDPGMTRIEANAVLAHELVHVERGIPPRDCPDLLRAKEESATRRETAARLVPLDDLRSFLGARSEIGPVTIEDVCDEFEVTPDVALDALRRVT